MTEEQKSVFISYRRKPASFIARAIFMDLRAHGYDVFMDVESINAGEFGTIIKNQIKARAHFLIILTTGTVGRLDEPNDWLRFEIEYAMEHKRNIVPLLINDFKYTTTTKKYLTGKLAALLDLNGLHVPHDFFDDAMNKLRTRYLKTPEYIQTDLIPLDEQPEVERKIEEAVAQPLPTKMELSAEDYFNIAIEQQNSGELDSAISDYDEALRLNPEYVEAYNNRGTAKYNKHDYDHALDDFNEAVRLNPQYAEVYSNRGALRRIKNDPNGALADFEAAIRIDPLYATTYKNRGILYIESGDLENAISDYQKYLNLGGGEQNGDRTQAEQWIWDASRLLDYKASRI